ncbi:hypothetical protein BC938DRAFT_480963 [Jimgerdemannia flammicorona]|uniref:Serine-threonine/tyrosine-protein kinase catalytic domain-containing protein n=1 Tax=Jimgerdemannia flammicorona TaxID=994334 RepID=A0A433QHF2_9FUNG|nr:hypothetical protein BC938DRAFT_480963 [Jimgerdemannia flammicorona]
MATRPNKMREEPIPGAPQEYTDIINACWNPRPELHRLQVIWLKIVTLENPAHFQRLPELTQTRLRARSD